MDWPDSFILVPMVLLVTAFVVGYVVCYFIVGPILLRKHNVRTIGLWVGGVLYVEHELKKLGYALYSTTHYIL